MSRLRERLRGDAGVTLVEVVATIAILSLVVPVLAMAVMTAWNSAMAASRSATAASELALLQVHFTGDVAESTGTVLGGAPCAPPLDGAAATTLATFTVPGGKVSYVLAGQRSEYDGSMSVPFVRVDCSGPKVHQAMVGAVTDGKVPSFGCVPSSVPGDSCRTIHLTVPDVEGPIVLSATRRVT